MADHELRRLWSREELLAVLRLYCHTSFGRLHSRNPEIVTLAERIGRTANAVAMKACNFASLDPAHQARQVAGLANASQADHQIWSEFLAHPSAVAEEAEQRYEQLLADSVSEEQSSLPAPSPPDGPTEVVRSVRTRRVQRFFRASVLVGYDGRCALSGLNVPDLLVASHIIPWSADEGRRADPRNGVLLNALYDRAFDSGLITFDEEFRTVLSPTLRTFEAYPFIRDAITNLDGRPLTLPQRFLPDTDALNYHRENVFRAF